MRPGGGSGTPLRVALLLHSYGARAGSLAARDARHLARALRDAGHHPLIVCSHVGSFEKTADERIPLLRVPRLPEAALHRRGFTGPLTGAPGALAALLGARVDVAHAFSVPDALSARLWRRLTGRPALLTCSEPATREGVADRRLRLSLLGRAVEQSDAVIAPTEPSRAALSRWLAVDAELIDAQDARTHVQLYRDLLGVS